MIELQGITKIYGKGSNAFEALSEVDLLIKTGQTVAIVGKSGSGKSTLMHIMSGLDRPTDGHVLIDGKNLHKLGKREIDSFRATEMSFIFQAFFVEPNQTAYQNVVLPLEIANIPRHKRSSMVKKALERVDLSEKVNEYARNLSGGQKQRLAIARAVVNNPKIIFADEPTGNLDSVTGDKIIRLLFELNKKLGSTLVVVTHDEELAGRCKVQVNLKDGQVHNKSAKRRKVAK